MMMHNLSVQFRLSASIKLEITWCDLTEHIGLSGESLGLSWRTHMMINKDLNKNYLIFIKLPKIK
jgi:hypothetical protein